MCGVDQKLHLVIAGEYYVAFLFNLSIFFNKPLFDVIRANNEI